MNLYKLKHLLTFVFLACLSIELTADKVYSQENTTVSEGKQISIEYTLKLEDKSVVDSNVGAEPLTFVQGSHNMIPGLENALDGMKIGESKQVTVKPENAYGAVNKDAVTEVKKEQIPEDSIKVGMVLQGQNPDGKVVIARIVEIKENTVILDYNHPLAGETLYFDVKVLDVQDAPEPEPAS